MCGIAGLINLSGKLTHDEMAALATRMADSFRHRGPDDAGVWVDPTGTCALSQRRLSIIDLSPLGHQPMIHAPTGAAITFNGEIYNYQTLSSALAAKGHRFNSTSDTEVLLAGLVEEGAAYVDGLDGMFAFGFFDPRSKMLMLARDAFGEKPLYYARTDDWFAFASELSALALLPGFDNRISRDRVATYLTLQYLPAPQTIYLGANKLLPGHVLMLAADGIETITQYFRFEPAPTQKGQRPLDDLADELEEILKDTIRTRMIADVPLGAFLSGGVDSSTVVALASRMRGDPIQTFSVGFEGSEDNEHDYACRMAAHLGTQHRGQVLPLEALKTGRHIAQVLDEPNGDTGTVPTWMLARETRRHVTVALSGDGADELFGGYARYTRTLEDEAAGGVTFNLAQTYYSPRIFTFTEPAVEKFMGGIPPETQATIAAMRRPMMVPGLPTIQKLREADVAFYMHNAVLAKVDRMSMQHALEVRAPFLGRRVADFTMRMAGDDLCTLDQTKRVLKQVAARYIPRDWLERRKMGLGLPLRDWGGPNLTEEVAQLFAEPDCRFGQWLTADQRARFIAYHRQTPMTYQLWVVFLLELWLRHHPHRAV